eukprot:gnl/MRDRNA2_/MRDRNA2_72852_c0_seq2.p1 gnl/MRDRNA2_/MRDRNA2_72852_c0~~gnl/MRDRNA2_/MRDRNA2_72852_c0_seq2.p1  ORF type:complete len:219 (-),score=37.20 gnl/MRDRNA2_/MRDRNA2_72852_c0_seq2:32-688(-)
MARHRGGDRVTFNIQMVNGKLQARGIQHLPRNIPVIQERMHCGVLKKTYSEAFSFGLIECAELKCDISIRKMQIVEAGLRLGDRCRFSLEQNGKNNLVRHVSKLSMPESLPDLKGAAKRRRHADGIPIADLGRSKRKMHDYDAPLPAKMTATGNSQDDDDVILVSVEMPEQRRRPPVKQGKAGREEQIEGWQGEDSREEVTLREKDIHRRVSDLFANI